MKTNSIRKVTLALMLLLYWQTSFAQLYQVAGTCTMQQANTYGPMYSAGNSDATSRTAVIYPASQLSGIAGEELSAIYFKKMTANDLTGTPNLKLYLKETPDLDFGTEALDWSTVISEAALVYDSNPGTASSGGAGWKQFSFSSNFTYSGTNNLILLMEYVNTGNNVLAQWEVESGNTCINTGNNNTTKYITTLDGVPGTSLSNSNYRRPHILFDFLLDCPLPENIAISDITATGATVNWTAGGTETAWEYTVEVQGNGVESFTSATSTTLNLVNLSPGVNYEFYVRANCGGGGGDSPWKGPYGFLTACGTLAPPTVTQNFTGFLGVAPGTLPCWSEATGTLDNPLTGTTSAWQQQNYNGDSTHPNSTSAYLPLNINRNEWLITPEVDLGDGSISYQMEFDVSVLPLSGTTPVTDMGEIFVKVVVSTDGGATWSASNVIQTYDSDNIPGNGGYTDYLPLSGYTGVVKFAFYGHFSQGVGNPSLRFYIDNWRVNTVAECVASTSMTADNITVNSADLSWENDGTFFDIEWGLSGFIQEEGAWITDITSTSYTLSGLNHSTAYEYYVRQSYCGADGGYGNWVGPYSFTTMQPAVLNYSQDFEGDHGWTLSNGTQTNKWVVGEATNNGGTYSLYISNDEGVSNTYTINAASVVHAYRDIQIPATGVNSVLLSYDWKGQGQGCCDYIRVWVVPGTFTPTPGTQISVANSGGVQFGGNQNSSVNWANQQFEVPVTDYAGQLVKVVFEWRNDNNTGTSPAGAIDNVEISIIECAAPQNLMITDITYTTADLSWSGDGSLFDIEYGVAGFTQGTGTTVTDITNPYYTATELDHSTSYQYYVRQNCGNGDESGWTGPFSFTTPCAPVDEFFENFDSYPIGPIVPNCWERIIIASGIQNISPINPASGTMNMYQYGSNTSNQSIVILPEVTNLNLGTHWLRFKANATGGNGVLQVGYITDITDANTFVHVQTLNITNTTYTAPDSEYTVAFPTTTPANVRIAIKNPALTTAGHYWDDVYWEAAPTCLPPHSLTATNITQTTAELSWASEGNLFDIEYGEVGFIQGTGTMIAEVTNSYTVTGLNPSTSHQYYVRQNCGDGDESTWTGPYSFTMLCAPVTMFFENFDSYGTGNIVPDCWDRIISGSGLQTISSAGSASGTRHVSQISSNTSNATVVVLPEVSNINTGTHWLRFKARVNLGTGHLQVGYITDTTDVSTFVEVLPVTITNTVYTLGSAEYVVPFPSNVPSNARIAVRNPGTSAAEHFWDDVYWEVAPICMYPLGLSATNNSQSSTILSWISDGSLFDIEYGLEGFTPGNGTTISGVGNPYTLTGLTPGTTYQYYVRQDCGEDGGYSIWNGPFEFTAGAYTGNIPTMLNTNPSVDDDVCATSFSIEVPEGQELVSLNVQYTMNSFNGAWISQQRSVLYSPTLNAGEADVAAGEEDYPGSITYNRNVDFANGATGTVEFVLKAWRTNHGTGCNSDYVYVMDGSWILTPQFELIPTCPNPPAELGYTNITEDSVDLIWESEEGTLFEVRWGALGFDPEDEGTLISGITTTSYTLSGLDSSIAYEFYVRRDCSAGDEEDYGDWAGPFTFNSGHCLPTSQLTQYISAFSTGLAIENISYTSTAMNPGGYGNKTDLVVSREPGESFTFSTNFIGGQNAVRIWVDWNHNFLFEEDEEVFSGSNPGPGNLVTGSVAIPAGAAPGNYVMRVRTVYGASASPQPCGEVQYGEALDFTLHVACVIAAPAGEAAQVFTPGQTLADLDVTGTGLTWYAEETLETILEDSTELVHGVTYYVVSSDDDCQSEVLAITVTEVVNTTGFDRYAFKYYPNPVSEVLYLTSNMAISEVVVLTMLGQKLNVFVQPGNTQVDMSGLPSGNYLLNVTIDGVTRTFKIVKH